LFGHGLAVGGVAGYTSPKRGGTKKRPPGKIVGSNSTMAMLPLDYIEFFVFLAALCLVGFLSGRGERGLRLTIF
jgi:hypothetical protein